MTDSYSFQKRAKEEVVKYELDTYNRELNVEDVQVVFQAYVLGQMKATLVVAKNTQSRYYEVSYSSVNNKMFVDVYSKLANKVIDLN